MFVYVCSMWNWRAILQMRGANLAIQDGVQDGRHFFPIKAKTFSQAQKFYLLWLKNKRAQRALGRSPEEKVKGHSGSNNREPQGHILNNFGRGLFDDVIH